MSALDNAIASMQGQIATAQSAPAVAMLISQRNALLVQLQNLNVQIATALGSDVLQLQQAVQQLQQLQNRLGKTGVTGL